MCIRDSIYTATVTDALGCTTSASFNLGFWNHGVFIAGTPNDAQCGYDNGFIELIYFSGTPPHQFQWSNGDTTQNLQNLTAGTYTITISDSRGCVGTRDWDIQSESSSSLGILFTQPLCLNQAATFVRAVPPEYPQIEWTLQNPLDSILSVSYTHLTLPTSDLV